MDFLAEVSIFILITWRPGFGASVADSFEHSVESCGVISGVYHAMQTAPRGQCRRAKYWGFSFNGEVTPEWV